MGLFSWSLLLGAGLGALLGIAFTEAWSAWRSRAWRTRMVGAHMECVEAILNHLRFTGTDVPRGSGTEFPLLKWDATWHHFLNRSRDPNAVVLFQKVRTMLQTAYPAWAQDAVPERPFLFWVACVDEEDGQVRQGVTREVWNLLLQANMFDELVEPILAYGTRKQRIWTRSLWTMESMPGDWRWGVTQGNDFVPEGAPANTPEWLPDAEKPTRFRDIEPPADYWQSLFDLEPLPKRLWRKLTRKPRFKRRDDWTLLRHRKW